MSSRESVWDTLLSVAFSRARVVHAGLVKFQGEVCGLSVVPYTIGYSVRVMFTNAVGPVRGIAISACKIIEWVNHNTPYLETVLIGDDDQIIFVEDLGYPREPGVCLFENLDAVLAEIFRLLPLVEYSK